MQCMSPIFIRQKNGERQFVPCGKCNFCLMSRRADWTFRLKEQQKVSVTAYFLTLTYDDEHLPSDGKVDKRELQLFFKRIRKQQDNIIKELSKVDKKALKWPKIKYYAVGEYGTKTKRAHYHAIMYNMHPILVENIYRHWTLGHSMCVPSNGATIHYTTKYVINNEESDYKGFSLISKGLGESYELAADYHRSGNVSVVYSDGVPQRLPRYYKDRFFTGWQKKVIAKRTENEMQEKYDKEVERLSYIHPNPVAYISERTINFHESVKKKINKQNKI
nr:MAG: replication initiator protein [Microvirus sp.]